MGKRRDRPEAATDITKFDKLKAIVENVVSSDEGGLVVIVGPPGIRKSWSVREVLADRQHLHIEGSRCTPLMFYVKMFRHKHQPLVLDDPDPLLRTPDGKDYIRRVTSSEPVRRIEYNSTSYKMDADHENVPDYFYTTSPVVMILNSWDSDDDVLWGLESRAEFVYFKPDWAECYKEWSKWYWDQEIYDYLHARLGLLKRPDCRLLMKAHKRKKAGNKVLPWQEIIDQHIECGETEMLVRELLDDKTIKSNNAKAEEFVKRGGGVRMTFYNHKREIESYRPYKAVPKITLTHKAPPELVIPPDGFVPGGPIELAGSNGDDRDDSDDDQDGTGLAAADRDEAGYEARLKRLDVAKLMAGGWVEGQGNGRAMASRLTTPKTKRGRPPKAKPAARKKSRRKQVEESLAKLKPKPR